MSSPSESNSTTDTNAAAILRENIPAIVARWASEVRKEIQIATGQEDESLYNNIPALLANVADALSTSSYSYLSERSRATAAAAKEHGIQRTRLTDFTLEDVIQEYRILRRTVLEVVGRHHAISSQEMIILLESIDCGLTEAATEFTFALGFRRSRIYREVKEETQKTKEQLRDVKIELKDTKVELNEANVSLDQLSELSSELELLVKRRTADLTDAIQSRDQFIAVASHELKTPLTSLKMETQLIKRYLQDGNTAALQAPKMKLLIDKADVEIKRLERLISDMLDVSRIRLGKLPLSLEKTCLEPLVKECVDFYREQISGNQISVRVIAQGEVCGNWDRSRIEQIVTNLLSNAIKYGAGKPVEIVIDSRDKIARLSVIDHGIGIAKDDQDRIFERFERVSTAKSVTGFGIGLFITKHFVLAHKGTIRIESELGKGATFIVELPLEKSD